MQVAASTKAQITLNEKNASIRKILESISKQSGYDFVYSDQDLKDIKPVTVKLENATIEKALQACFTGQPLIYEINDKTVVVRKQEDKSVIETVKDYFATIDVRSKVLDEKGNPLQGVSVRVRNSNQFTITDIYGTFQLKNVPENAILVFTYIGYKSDEIEAKAFVPGATVQLQPSSSKLDEVQIQAYGVTSRRLSTSDITTVKAEDIAKQPVDNPLLALQGRISGLIITPTSGVPGAGIKVQLRGQNSLFTSSSGSSPILTEPLYIIDGIPYANNISPIGGANAVSYATISALSFINPADIESISVLKDADATAIYGSRGANGVILITTKKGKIGLTRVDANVSIGYGQVAKKLDLLNTQQYIEMRKEAYKNDGVDFATFPYNLPSLKNSMAPDLFVWDQNHYTDWQNELIGGTARYTNTQASLSGGSSTIQYLISGVYSKQGYVFPGDGKNESGGSHFSLTGNSANQKLRATLTGGYGANTAISPPSDFTKLAVALPPNAPSIFRDNGELNWEPNPASPTKSGTWLNPFSLLIQSNTAKSKTLNGNLDINYKLLPFLTIKTVAGFSEVNGDGYRGDPLLSHDPATWSTRLRKSLTQRNASSSWSVEPQIIFSKAVNKGQIDALFGSSFQGQRSEYESLSASGFGSDALLKNLNSATTIIGTNRSDEYRYMSIFGRVTYNWAGKYIVNLNGRRDGSSRFGPDRQFGNFGSVGTAWIFTEEPIVRNLLPFLSFGKARFSYGKSGNDAIDNYRYLEFYSSNGFRGTYQGIVPISSTGVANPYYSWEDVRKMEFGLDLGFLKDRLLFTGAYYRNRSSNQIGRYTLPNTAGNSDNFVANQPATIQNSGLEFTLMTVNVKSNTFNWISSFNVSIQRSKLLAVPLTGGYGQGIDSAHIGQPFAGVVYGFHYMGVDPSTGSYQFADKQGNPTSDPYADLDGNYRVITAPMFFGGLSNTFTYRGFSLDVFLQFTKQMGINYLYDPILFNNPGYLFSTNGGLIGGNRPVTVLNRWQNPGDISKIQKFSASNPDVDQSYALAQASDVAYTDASFIRIKNISLSYTISQSWKQKMKIQSMKIYIQGQNLWTFTKYKGLDPETQSLTVLPPLRIVTAGVQIGL